MQVLVLRRFFLIVLVGVLVNSLCLLSACQVKPKLTREQLITQAETHLKSGNFHKALTELGQILNDDPNNVQLHLDMGWIYLYTDRLDKASGEVELVRKLEPDNGKVNHLRGAIYEKLGQHVEALDAYNEALKTDVNNPKLHGDIANVFLELNQPNAALQEYQVANKLDPQNGSYVFGQCRAYRQLKEYKQAVESCEKADSMIQGQAEKDQIQNVIETTKLLESIEPSIKSNKPQTH